MSEIWGADVMDFNPERWLGDTSVIDKAFFAVSSSPFLGATSTNENE